MATYILVDNSGSMSESHDGRPTKIACAVECASCLAEVMTQLKIPFTVTGFQTGGRKLARHNIAYTWGSPQRRTAIPAMMASSCNADFLSIATAAGVLHKYPTKHRMLIVLSDGLPCWDENGDQTKKAINDARSKGIDVVGIAINCTEQDMYAHMYGKDFVKVEATDDMFLKIAQVFKDVVKKWQD